MKDQPVQRLLLWKAIYWIGNITQLNKIGFVNIEVKYHLESQIHFLDKIFILVGQQMNKNVYFVLFFMKDLQIHHCMIYGKQPQVKFKQCDKNNFCPLYCVHSTLMLQKGCPFRLSPERVTTIFVSCEHIQKLICICNTPAFILILS